MRNTCDPGPALLPIALLCLLTGPLAAAQAPRQQPAQPMEHLVVHNHQPLLVPDGALQPALEIRLYPDPANGFNLELLVANYQLESPQLAGDAPPGLLEGHAHLMINGKKRIRLYGQWQHLDKSLFKPGINQLTVTLNSHQHYTWVTGRQPILATVFVDPDKQPAVQHQFASHPLPESPHTNR